MKQFRNAGWAALGSVILLAFYLVNRGILVGSTTEKIGIVSGTTQPIYQQTCRYLSLNGIEHHVEPPRLSNDGICPLFWH